VNEPKELRVVAPCFGTRFSGVTASLIAVLPEQAKHFRIAAMGFHLPPAVPAVSFGQFFFQCWDRRWRIWHARRNVEMIAGLILRHIFRFKLILVFTSAAQRQHTWVTRFCCRHMNALIATTRKAAAFLEQNATVVHHGGASTRMLGPALKRQYLGSTVRMLTETESESRVWLFRIVVLAQHVPMWVLARPTTIGVRELWMALSGDVGSLPTEPTARTE